MARMTAISSARLSIVLVVALATLGPASDSARAQLAERFTPPARGERRPDKLQVGDAAPDFTLADPTGKKEVTLSGFGNKKPVLLIFGSCT